MRSCICNFPLHSSCKAMSQGTWRSCFGFRRRPRAAMVRALARRTRGHANRDNRKISIYGRLPYLGEKTSLCSPSTSLIPRRSCLFGRVVRGVGWNAWGSLYWRYYCPLKSRAQLWRGSNTRVTKCTRRSPNGWVRDYCTSVVQFMLQ